MDSDVSDFWISVTGVEQRGDRPIESCRCSSFVYLVVLDLCGLCSLFCSLNSEVTDTASLAGVRHLCISLSWISMVCVHCSVH